METENEVKTDPEPQQNGEEKMEHAAENGEGANRDATSVDQKPGTLIYLYVNVYIVILKIIKCDVICLSNRSDINELMKKIEEEKAKDRSKDRYTL